MQQYDGTVADTIGIGLQQRRGEIAQSRDEDGHRDDRGNQWTVERLEEAPLGADQNGDAPNGHQASDAWRDPSLLDLCQLDHAMSLLMLRVITQT